MYKNMITTLNGPVLKKTALKYMVIMEKENFFCCLFTLILTTFFEFDLSRILGTPTEEQWPRVTLLHDWHTYPKWEPQNLARTVPTLGPDGVDLLTKMLKYNPAERISAKAALDHPYFDSLDKSQF
ncbi:hypothetical protein S83_062894 [Arachis hypogaea]